MNTPGQRLMTEARTLATRVRLKLALTRDTVRSKWPRLRFEARNFLLNHRPVTAEVDGVRFRLLPRGAMVADFWSGLRSVPNKVRFLLDVLQPGMTFLELGSNVGLFSIAAAKKLGAGSVYAVEPRSWAFQLLQENLRLNGLGNVAAFQVAIGNSAGEATLDETLPGDDGRSARGAEKIAMTTLDAFLETRGLKRVDVMKVDAEGAEFWVFRGGENLLLQPDAPLILYDSLAIRTKKFGYHPVEAMWLLQDCGYSLFGLDSENGEISSRRVDSEYNGTVVAAKPGHPACSKLGLGTR